MAIRVKTDGATGQSEHVVTEDGLRAAGIDVTLYDPKPDLEFALDELEGDMVQGVDSDDLFDAIARLRKHFSL